MRQLASVNEFGLDVPALQRRLDARMESPVRVMRGIFRAPSDMDREQLARHAYLRINQWIEWAGKLGWELVSRPEIVSKDISRTDDGLPVLGEYTYTVHAGFTKPQEIMRTEIDPALVRSTGG